MKKIIFVSDTKNSVGLVGCIEEMAHNAIAVYWNPLESSAKVSEFSDFYYLILKSKNNKKLIAEFEHFWQTSFFF